MDGNPSRRVFVVRDVQGFTLIELLIVVAVIGILAAIAVPGLLSARASGNQASAIGSLRTIHSSQAAYSSGCGRGFFAATLSVLGTPPTTGGLAFISPELGAAASVTKSGYTITMAGATAAPAATPVSCNGGALRTGYYAKASPASANSGTRFFFTNGSGGIFEKAGAFTAVNETGQPGGASLEAGAQPIQ